MLSYWFYPNPGSTSYGNPKVLLLFALCALLVAGSFLFSAWRKRVSNPVAKRLSHAWPSAMRWFGGIGAALVIARVEEIQFLAMRAFWLLWVLSFAAYVLVQLWKFRVRHYTIVPKAYVEDPRARYLPKGG